MATPYTNISHRGKDNYDYYPSQEVRLAVFVTFFFYAFFIKNEVENLGLFFIVLVLASSGLAGVLSLMSAISSKASGNFAIMSILSFPVLMPLILVVIRLSKQAVDGLEWAGVGFDFIVILTALNVLTIALSLLLFPYLWRD